MANWLTDWRTHHKFFDVWTSDSGPTPSVSFHILTWKCAWRHSGVHVLDIWTSKVVQDRPFFHILTWKCTFDIWTSKSGPRPSVQFLSVLTYKCALRHNLVRFFDIWTSKDGLSMLCVCTFLLKNALHATAACNFSISELQKVVMCCCALCILTWNCASRHSGVQFFVSLLNSYLRTRCFSEPTFGPSRTTNHWKNTAILDFPNISRVCISFLVNLLSLLFMFHIVGS